MDGVVGEVVHVPGVGAVDNVEMVGAILDVFLRLPGAVPPTFVEAFGVEGTGVVSLSGHGAEGGGLAAFGVAGHGVILSHCIGEVLRHG